MKTGSAKMKISRSFLSALILSFSCNLVFSQEMVFRGKVADPEKKPLQNVKITFQNPSTGAKFSLKSKKDGSFMKLGMPSGVYRAKLELDGYFPLEIAVEVKFGDEEEHNFTMDKVPPKIGDDPDLAEAMKYFQESKFDMAIEYFQKGAAKFPQSVEIPYNLGICYLRSGRADEAIASFEKAISLKPDLIDPYYALGECYFIKGDSDKALATFKKALELQPDSGRVYYNLGIIYYKNNMTVEAINYFEQAKTLSPDFTSTFYQLGLAYIKKGDFAKAIENLEKFLALEPNAPEAAATKKMIEELKKQIK